MALRTGARVSAAGGSGQGADAIWIANIEAAAAGMKPSGAGEGALGLAGRARGRGRASSMPGLPFNRASMLGIGPTFGSSVEHPERDDRHHADGYEGKY